MPINDPVPVVESILTALPTEGVDGQVINYLADSTNGVLWRLRYRAAIDSPYKWEFIGGSNMLSEVTAQDGVVVAGTTYVDGTTVGPDLTIPLAGDYYIFIGLEGFDNVADGAVIMSYAIGSTAASDNDKVEVHSGSGTQGQWSGSRPRRKTITAASTLLRAKYRSSAASTFNIRSRWIMATPIRVGYTP